MCSHFLAIVLAKFYSFLVSKSTSIFPSSLVLVVMGAVALIIVREVVEFVHGLHSGLDAKS